MNKGQTLQSFFTNYVKNKSNQEEFDNSDQQLTYFAVRQNIIILALKKKV